MPKIDCIKDTLDEICMTHCSYVDYCPVDSECAYRIRIRETIEDIRDDNPDERVEQA